MVHLPIQSCLSNKYMQVLYYQETHQARYFLLLFNSSKTHMKLTRKINLNFSSHNLGLTLILTVRGGVAL